MDVQARSFRGFRIVGRGVGQAAVDQARVEIEGVLEKHGVTAADIAHLERRYLELGQSGLDLEQMGADVCKRYGIDLRHIRAKKHIFEVLRAARKLGPTEFSSLLFFKADPVPA